MSMQPAQAPPSASPVVVVGSRVRNPNSESMGNGKGIKDTIFVLGSIGFGALAGYFLADYANKHKLLEKILGKPNETDTGDITGDIEEANIAYQTPLWPEVTDTGEHFDRTTRHTTGMAGKYYAYHGRVFNKLYLDEPVENMGEFNQIVTDNRVYQ